ncbi:hypothetical protein F1C16_06655 [Hymenobacter sp. NBH84]|uniref:Uncharacterized protein n=1 Tax=Hymenobacter defluvii TaxID=2054411 RepID=A0ABS3T7H0_9BACT|nr:MULTISPECIES: hypothetical protein [Hymenobacter]MBO3269590.1 hypothetical protein [Hymenobacter defluvii]QNE39262.1 hypothetical protein F1C16_06655 [Hymenobacter sp. NBH84]
MALIIDNRNFRLVIASDVNPRDGLGWELWEGHTLLLEIFRHDDLKKITFSTFHQGIDIPIEALEYILNNFNTTGGRNFIEDFEEDSSNSE